MSARVLHLRGIVVVPSKKAEAFYEDESFGDGSFGLDPSQHQRNDFLQEV
jgi:hypothetical protein